MKNEEKKIKIVYAEPADYFPKEIREKYKLGEFAEPKQEDTEAKEEYLVNCGGIQPIVHTENDNKETEKELNWENYEDMLKRKEAKKK